MSMNIISDLHLESWIEEEGHREKIENIIDDYYGKQGGRVVILDGDVSTNLEDIRVVIKMLKERFDHVLYVYGNIEYSLKPIKGGDRFLTLEDKLRNIEVVCGEGVHILQGDSVKIDGITYYGASGGMDPVQVYKATGKGFKQYFDENLEKMVGKTGLDWTSDDYVKFYLERYDEVIRRPKIVDVMITHYAPTFRDGLFIADKPNTYINVPLDGVGTWVFGHVHKFLDEEVNGTRFLNRSMGRKG